MTLFTKSLCSACQQIQKDFDLGALGVDVEELEPDNPGALALLAWHELVEAAEKQLPLLVVNGSVLRGKETIEKYLRKRWEETSFQDR
jgi:hypothetical protein